MIEWLLTACKASSIDRAPFSSSAFACEVWNRRWVCWRLLTSVDPGPLQPRLVLEVFGPADTAGAWVGTCDGPSFSWVWLKICVPSKTIGERNEQQCPQVVYFSVNERLHHPDMVICFGSSFFVVCAERYMNIHWSQHIWSTQALQARLGNQAGWRWTSPCVNSTSLHLWNILLKPLRRRSSLWASRR